MSFSGNGKVFLTASGTSFRLWDAATGKTIGPRRTNPFPITGFDVSHDGAVIRVAGQANRPEQVRQWSVPSFPLRGSPEQIRCWLEVATCLRLDDGNEPRSFSVAEWQKRWKESRQLGEPAP